MLSRGNRRRSPPPDAERGSHWLCLALMIALILGMYCAERLTDWLTAVAARLPAGR